LQQSADFITGFLFGAGYGGYDEKAINECLKKEPKSEQFFNNAN
jgi:hypothetical protein